MTDKEIYLKYRRWLKKKAGQHYRKAKFIEYEDLESEANLSFIKALRRFQNKKIPFVVYISKTIDRDLGRFVNRNRNIFYGQDAFTEETSLPYKENFVDKVCLKDWLLSMSTQAQIVVDTVFTIDINKISSKKNKITVNSLTMYLIGNNWKQKDIRKTFREIKQHIAKFKK